MSDTKVIFSLPVTVEGSENFGQEENVLEFEEIDYIRYVPTNIDAIQAWLMLPLVLLSDGSIILLISKQANDFSTQF